MELFEHQEQHTFLNLFFDFFLGKKRLGKMELFEHQEQHTFLNFFFDFFLGKKRLGKMELFEHQEQETFLESTGFVKVHSHQNTASIKPMSTILKWRRQFENSFEILIFFPFQNDS